MPSTGDWLFEAMAEFNPESRPSLDVGFPAPKFEAAVLAASVEGESVGFAWPPTISRTPPTDALNML